MPYSANVVWLNTLNKILSEGSNREPRGQKTYNLQHHAIHIDMASPVITIPSRRLNYRFMAAEAYWMLNGDDRVENIAPYNSKIADFSDDGKTFFGAYGPRFVDQLPYVVNKLSEDSETRQAGMTFWRPNPPATKDVPCTIALFFELTDNPFGGPLLDLHVFMRSSDAWLGLPYDVFNFSMMAYLIAGYLVGGGIRGVNTAYGITPGTLHLTTASSHLYERDKARAVECLTEAAQDGFAIPDLVPLDRFNNPARLMMELRELRETKPGDSRRWWEVHGHPNVTPLRPQQQIQVIEFES